MAAGAWRVVRGNPSAEEVAALAAVLCAVLSRPEAPSRGGPAVGARHAAAWLRPVTAPGAPTSWAAGPPLGRRIAA